MNTDIDFIRRYTKKPKNNKNLILLTIFSHIVDTVCEEYIELRGFAFKSKEHFEEVYYKLYREMAEAAISKYLKDDEGAAEPDVWNEFVAKHYPDYDHAQQIADADDLEKLLHDEVNGCAEEILHEDYDGDIKNPQIQIDYDSIHADIYRRSIEAFLEK